MKSGVISVCHDDIMNIEDVVVKVHLFFFFEHVNADLILG